MSRSEPGYSHPRCYARLLADCSRKISNEHFFSEALGKEIGHRVIVSGMAWQKGNKHPDSAANANILCGAHNTNLSGLDTAIAQFFGAIRDFDRRLCRREGGDESVTFDGTLIERWFLKVLCGLTAANVTASEGSRVSLSFDDAFVAPLFGRQPWPLDFRLGYLQQNPVPIPTASIRIANEVNYRLATKDGRSKALEVRLNGLVFGLRTEPLDEPNWAWRPAGIRFLAPGVTKTIELSWPLYESGYVDLRLSTT